MSEPFCKPCEDKGVKRKAHRMSKPPMCSDCYAESQGAPRPNSVVLERLAALRKERQATILTETGGKSMGTKTLDVNWDAVQQDRNAGVGIEALMEKYGAARPTIYAHTTTPVGDRGARAKPVHKTGTSTSATYKPSKIKRTGSGYDQVLEDLRMKRDQLTQDQLKLNQIITAIEALG